MFAGFLGMCSKTTSLDSLRMGRILGLVTGGQKEECVPPFPRQPHSQEGLNYGSQFCMPVSEDQAGQLHGTRQKVGYVVCLFDTRTHYSNCNTKFSF